MVHFCCVNDITIGKIYLDKRVGFSPSNRLGVSNSDKISNKIVSNIYA